MTQTFCMSVTFGGSSGCCQYKLY